MPDKGPPSLRTLALRQCLRYASQINDVGSAPFELVEPVLRKMSARQLVDIERESPQIKARSEEIWRSFLVRDFSNRPMPTPGRFRRTYVKYAKEKDENLLDASIRLRQGLARFNEEKASRTITTLSTAENPRVLSRSRTYGSSTLSFPGYGMNGQPRSKIMQKALHAARASASLSSRAVKFASLSNAASGRVSKSRAPTAITKTTDASSRPASAPASVTGPSPGVLIPEAPPVGAKRTAEPLTPVVVKRARADVPSVFLPSRRR